MGIGMERVERVEMINKEQINIFQHYRIMINSCYNSIYDDAISISEFK